MRLHPMEEETILRIQEMGIGDLGIYLGPSVSSLEEAQEQEEIDEVED